MNILSTIEGLEDDDMTAEHMAYECRTYPVECFVCGEEDCDTEPELKRKGWRLGDKEYCPECKV